MHPMSIEEGGNAVSAGGGGCASTGTDSQACYVLSLEGGVIAEKGSAAAHDANFADQADDNYAASTTIAPSVISSVLTKEELHDASGFNIVCWVVFLADMSRGVVFPTMWPLIQSLGGTEVDLGYAVAAFSVGRAICAPVFGKGSVRYGYTNTLLLSAAILLVGSLLYAQAPLVGSPGFVVFVQTLLGIGSGTLGVSRAYTAEVTAQRAKTTYLAWLSAVQYLGFSATPLLGSTLTKFFENESRVVDKGIFLLNELTAPGYLLCLLSAFTIGLLMTCFKDRRRAKPKGGAKSKKRASIDEVANSKTFIGISTYTACILGCMYLNVVVKGVISCFETLGIQVAQSSFGMTSSYAGTIVAICGFIGTTELLMMGYITRVMSDVQMIIGGMAVLIAGMSGLIGLNDGAENAEWRYIFVMFMVYGVGYSVTQAAVLGLFSKVVGRVPQGELMGWFSVVGAVSRVIYPLLSGYIVYYRDIGLLCTILIGTMVVSILYVVANRKEFSHLSL